MKTFTFLALTFTLFLVSSTKSPYKKILKKTEFTFVPSGDFEFNEGKVSVNAFLMLNHEVTNFEYKEFIKSQYLSKGDSLGAILALPDTAAWLDSTNFNGSFMDPFASLYHQHPAYNNYPVVNVSKENARKYCVWLTSKMRKLFPENSFNDFRLPTKSEWIYAAKGGLKNSPYPWGGPYTRNSKGCYLANFKTIGENNLTGDENGNPKIVNVEDFIPESIGDGAFGPAVTKTYHPNNYGLYNMVGNVAELVTDQNKAMGGHWQSFGNDIQVTSEIDCIKANPLVGFRPVMSYSGL